ncbi:viral A-type inclusion protein [Planoprotostelium fungivorum]|uniref:Viral A-type inclusion protein n=1 Tax=Planoprotostelium fungivorum TaxID=1890364 RepID=A0A2P6MZ15_9EUKA|nr:viral A-type inclusion protein [Planoprotostelium fungivorum]
MEAGTAALTTRMKNTLGSPYDLRCPQLNGDRVQDQFISCINALVKMRSKDEKKPQKAETKPTDPKKRPHTRNEVKRYLPEFTLGVNSITRKLEKSIKEKKTKGGVNVPSPFSLVIIAREDKTKPHVLCDHLPVLCYLSSTPVVIMEATFFCKLFDTSSVLALAIQSGSSVKEVVDLIQHITNFITQPIDIPHLQPLKEKLSSDVPIEKEKSKGDTKTEETKKEETKKEETKKEKKGKNLLNPLQIGKKREPKVGGKKKVDAWNTNKTNKRSLWVSYLVAPDTTVRGYLFVQWCQTSTTRLLWVYDIVNYLQPTGLISDLYLCSTLLSAAEAVYSDLSIKVGNGGLFFEPAKVTRHRASSCITIGSISHVANPALEGHKMKSVKEFEDFSSSEDDSREVEDLKSMLTEVPSRNSQSSIGNSVSNSARLWDELEHVYREMEQREKDYAIAVEIGKMLLDKNKELQDQNNSFQMQVKILSSQSHPTSWKNLEEEKHTIEEKNKRLKRKNKELRMQLSLVEKGKDSSEMKAILLSEEFSRMEGKLAAQKVEIASYRRRNSELSEELERVKEEAEFLREGAERLVVDRSTPIVVEEDVHDEEYDRLEEELLSISTAKERTEALLSELREENEQLKTNMFDRDDGRKHLETIIDNLTKTNRALRSEVEEQKMLSEQSKARAIDLEVALEMNQMMMEPTRIPNMDDAVSIHQFGSLLDELGMTEPGLLTDQRGSPIVDGLYTPKSAPLPPADDFSELPEHLQQLLGPPPSPPKGEVSLSSHKEDEWPSIVVDETNFPPSPIPKKTFQQFLDPIDLTDDTIAAAEEPSTTDPANASTTEPKFDFAAYFPVEEAMPAAIAESSEIVPEVTSGAPAFMQFLEDSVEMSQTILSPSTPREQPKVDILDTLTSNFNLKAFLAETNTSQPESTPTTTGQNILDDITTPSLKDMLYGEGGLLKDIETIPWDLEQEKEKLKIRRKSSESSVVSSVTNSPSMRNSPRAPATPRMSIGERRAEERVLMDVISNLRMRLQAVIRDGGPDMNERVREHPLIQHNDSLRMIVDLFLEYCNLYKKSQPDIRKDNRGYWSGSVHTFFGGWKWRILVNGECHWMSPSVYKRLRCNSSLFETNTTLFIVIEYINW